jgi:hypothetical protein
MLIIGASLMLLWFVIALIVLKRAQSPSAWRLFRHVLAANVLACSIIWILLKNYPEGHPMPSALFCFATVALAGLFVWGAGAAIRLMACLTYDIR